MRARSLALLATTLAMLAGCASTSPSPALHDVAHAVARRSGHTVSLRERSGDDAAAERAVDRLLRRELTASTAVAIALLENGELRARLEEVSISQADLVQAGLLTNPSFSLGRTAWEAEHLSPNIFASVEQDFLSLVTMPMRKRVANAELEATKLEVGDHVLSLAADVRRAFYTAQAAEQVVAMRRLVDDAASASAELSRRQHDAGTTSELAMKSALAMAAQTSLDLRRAEGEAAVAREELNKLMGLWGPRTAWKLGARLPEIPKSEPPIDRLESRAVSARLDLGAARHNVEAMRHALSLAKTTRWVGKVDVGVEAGRLRHNRRFSFGPAVTLEIPLFDQRRAQVARLEAFARQAERELDALAVDIRADVRAAHARVRTARDVALALGQVLVPLREGVVALSQEQYDAMLVGVYQLLQAKQSELDAYRESIEAVRDYWIARSDLERAVGGRVGEPPNPEHHAKAASKAPPRTPAP